MAGTLKQLVTLLGGVYQHRMIVTQQRLHLYQDLEAVEPLADAGRIRYTLFRTISYNFRIEK